MLLTLSDTAALGLFLLVWVAHTFATEGKFISRVSLSSAMNRQREIWMHTMAQRELRMIDTSIMIGLQQGTAFFASSSLIAIGGCVAMLNSRDTLHRLMSDLPFFQEPPAGVFELKVIGLIGILAYAFFKFGWSYRLFNYCSILVGAVPPIHDEQGNRQDLEPAVQRAAKMNVLAGRHFNSGLRAIFFSIGYLGWFAGPEMLALTTLLILAVLVRRQFFSRARDAVAGDMEAQRGPGNGLSRRPDSQ